MPEETITHASVRIDGCSEPQLRQDVYARNLAALIRHETISVTGVDQLDKFHAFHDLLRATFPHIFAAVELEDFDGSLLLRWPGTDPSALPVCFMNHMDVVEAAGEWTHPPFSGEIADGRLWGRGTLDDKGGLWGMLQAADELAAAGFVPARDIYFESACTEEIDGHGCDRISRTLQERGIRFAWTLDEGGMMMAEPISGAKGVFAMVGVGEKTVVTLRFVARDNGGHASTPGSDTGLVRLGRFMAAVEKGDVFKVELSPVIARMLQVMAPTVSGPLGFVFAHPQGLSPILKSVMPRTSAAARALMQTTIAFTMAGGSDGYNVLPARAWVVGNMRCSHHQPAEQSIAAISGLAAKYDLDVEVVERDIDSPLSSFDGEAFQLLERALAAVFPGVIASPYIMTGCSDSRFMTRVCDDCLRFSPFTITQEQMGGIHGIDECVDLSCLVPAVDFYRHLMTNA